MTYEEIRDGKGRVPCPKCGKKGVGFADEPHAFGWKDYSRARCRYCEARFGVVRTATVEEGEA